METIDKQLDKIESPKPRIAWVDLCKGFAMILVMIGHTSFPEWMQTWLYSFHMPLFFFLSGYVFSIKKYSGFRSFLWAKLRTIFIPATFFGLLISVIKFFLNGKENFLPYMFKRLSGIFIQLRGSEYDLGLWFFTCLFVVEIAFWVLLKITKDNNKLLIALLVLAAAVGYGYHYVIGRICPWSFEVACIAIGFFGIGYLVKIDGKQIVQKFGKFYYAIILWGANILLAWLQAGVLNGVSDLYAQNFGIPGLFHVTAFTGILASVATFELFTKLRFLKLIGRSTFVIYAMHQVTFQVLDKLFFADAEKTTWLGLLYLVLSLIVCTALSIVINRYAPWLLGKKPERKAQ